MKGVFVAIGLALTLTAWALACRPLLPIDETRYLSVAWEMNWRGDYMVSHMSGENYSHKPPLLFWLINLVWSIVGIHEIPARLVAPGAGVACLFLVRAIAKRLWPESPAAAWLAPVILSASFLWMLFSPMTMFDTLISMSMLLAVLGLQFSHGGRRWSGWLIVGAAIGTGLLAKGPVILLYVVGGLAAFAWLTSDDRKSGDQPVSNLQWLLRSLLAIAIGAAIVLAWAIPSAIIGGSEYAHDLFFGQTAGRMVKSFAHQRPIYWYMPFLPVGLLPWLMFPPAWQVFTVAKSDRAVKALLVWIAVAFALFSLISGKQLHYLLPLAPLWSLALARTLADQGTKPARVNVLVPALGACASALIPWVFNHVPTLNRFGMTGLFQDWSAIAFVAIGCATWLLPVKSLRQQVVVVASSAILWTCIVLVGARDYWRGYDLTALAVQLSEYREPIGWYGDYQAQVNFMGRIPQIERVLDQESLSSFLKLHNQVILVYPDQKFPRASASIPTGNRPVRDSDRGRATELSSRILEQHPHASAELLTVYTINRELNLENYFVFRVSE